LGRRTLGLAFAESQTAAIRLALASKVSVITGGPRTVTYGFGELDTLVPAYAATIHKSQGSEYRKPPVSTAGGLLCAAIGSHVYDDLYQVLDAMLGEGGYAILADPVDVQASVLGEHVDRQLVKPVLVLAEHFGDIADGEDVRGGGQGQAAWLTRAS
jgi:hypothetical protein